ncbi:MAG: sugar phosphate isomerase/epimerase family protein [Thermodesulfobacteriota bacterium]
MLFGAHVKSVEDPDVLREMGFDFGELVLSGSEKRALWQESGILSPLSDSFFLVAHGPVEGDPNDLKNIWERYFPSLQETVNLSARMGISYLTIHLYSDARFVKREVLEEKRRLLNGLVSYAAARNVRVGLENLSESAADLCLIADGVPDLAITLDVGHAQLLSEKNRSFEIIESLGPLIEHVHLHDNRGGSGHTDDLHLPIGEGNVDFPRVLGALTATGYDGTMTLEVPRPVLARSREIIRAILDAR